MGITTADRHRAQGVAPYVVVQPTSHYTIREGRVYRDTIVRRLTDGQLRVYLIPTATEESAA